MSNRIKVTALMALAIGLIISAIPTARAQDPTIPTRTPTPNPAQPTARPTATDDDPVPPAPTAQPQDPTAPAATATTTGSGGSGQPGGTAVPGAPGGGGTTPPGGGATSPGGGATPPGGNGTGPSTGSSCDNAPHAMAINTANVYFGPGANYQKIGELAGGEMRPIIGRHNFGPWWQIQFDQRTVGWVADAKVQEYGNTALIPVVAAPNIGGVKPTPGVIWNPTPLPLLTCVPTPAAPPATIVAGATVPSTPAATPAATGGMVTTEITAAAPTFIAPGPPVNPKADRPESIPDPQTSRDPISTDAMNLALPISGIGLIAGGIILALTSRKKAG